jgi:hypothetical protein
MNKSIVLVLINLFTFYLTTSGQKRINIEAIIQVNLPVSNDAEKEHKSADPADLGLSYFSRKKYTNPFFYALVNANYPISKRIKAGIQTGIQFHFNEVHFIGIKRTYIAIPLQAAVDYEIPISAKNIVGVSLAAGGSFYKINDYVYKINNAFLFNGSFFYKINKKHSVKIGLEKQIDNASFHYNVNNPNSNEVYNFSLNRLSLFAGYGFKF